MPRILIVFGTTDGQTLKIASRLAEQFRALAIAADVFHAADVPPDVRVETYDGVIVAASVHVGGYQKVVHRWVRANARVLNKRPGAFLSVCLGVLEPEPEPQAEVRAIIRKFLDRTGWKPAIARPVAGALPWSKYGWLKTLVMKRIVREKMGAVDTTKDLEFTDWDDLRHLALDFAERVRPTPASVPVEV